MEGFTAVSVHPQFCVEEKVWFTEDGIAAASLRELQTKLPNVHIEGYYPQGFSSERVAPTYEDFTPRLVTFKHGSPARAKKVKAASPEPAVSAAESAELVVVERQVRAVPSLREEAQRRQTMYLKSVYEPIMVLVGQGVRRADISFMLQVSAATVHRILCWADLRQDKRRGVKPLRKVAQPSTLRRNVWTPGMLKKLRGLAALGSSAAQISQAMNIPGVTRNAVIGCARRNSITLKFSRHNRK